MRVRVRVRVRLRLRVRVRVLLGPQRAHLAGGGLDRPRGDI